MSPLKELGLRISELKSTWSVMSKDCDHLLYTGSDKTPGCGQQKLFDKRIAGSDKYVGCCFEDCPYIEEPHDQED